MYTRTLYMVSPELSLVGLSVDASHWLAQFLPPTGQALLLVDAKLKRRSFGNNSRRRSWLTGKGLGIVRDLKPANTLR